MSDQASRLPPGFEALEPFVETWDAPTTAERAHLRDSSQEVEREAFYAAALAMAPAALDHLDQTPLDQFDARQQRLMNLMLSLCHVALAVENQGDAEAEHALLRPRMRFTRTSADERSFQPR